MDRKRKSWTVSETVRKGEKHLYHRSFNVTRATMSKPLKRKKSMKTGTFYHFMKKMSSFRIWFLNRVTFASVEPFPSFLTAVNIREVKKSVAGPAPFDLCCAKCVVSVTGQQVQHRDGLWRISNCDHLTPERFSILGFGWYLVMLLTCCQLAELDVNCFCVWFPKFGWTCTSVFENGCCHRVQNELHIFHDMVKLVSYT